MKLIPLNKDEVTSLYNERMQDDFIKDELKPLWVIHNAMDEGIYEPLGLSDGSALLGYAFIVKQEKNYLVDYLAVFPGVRNQGVGTKMLRLLESHLSDAEMIMLEVEDPAFAENEMQESQQKRRVAFYKRNGWKDTGLRVVCFGVPFIILRSKESSPMGNDLLWETYRNFYKIVLTEGKQIPLSRIIDPADQ